VARREGRRKAGKEAWGGEAGREKGRPERK